MVNTLADALKVFMQDFAVGARLEVFRHYECARELVSNAEEVTAVVDGTTCGRQR
jgi:hypothetical protein